MRKTYVYCYPCKAVKEYGLCEHDQTKLMTASKLISPVFKPYYSESHEVQVNSRGEHEKLCREKGPPLGDCYKQRERMAFVRKNKEEIISQRYAKIGLKYPKGQNVRFDEKNRRFIPA